MTKQMLDSWPSSSLGDCMVNILGMEEVNRGGWHNDTVLTVLLQYPPQKYLALQPVQVVRWGWGRKWKVGGEQGMVEAGRGVS